MKTYYGNLCSWFYDIDKPFAPKEEMNFYMSYISKGMSVLEPMCGSGRFLFEFVNRGFDIDGFDLSPDMIDRCRAKIDVVGYSGNLQCCNFSSFHSYKLYDCIYIAAYSFSLLINDNDIIFGLDRIKGLLKPGGKILMAVLTDIDYQVKADSTTTKVFDFPRTAKENDIEIVLNSTTTYDRVKSVTYSQMTYDLLQKGEFVKREEEDFYIKRYRPNEFEKFVEASGLSIAETFVDFNKSKFYGQDSETMVYVLTL